MPKNLRQLPRDAYCSAPPLTSTLRPPRLSREAEVRRPRAPLVMVKRDVTSSIESVEFVIDDDFGVDVKPVKGQLDPRQLHAGIAALAIRPPPSSASSSSGKAAAAAPGPSSWAVRGVALSEIPGGELGPADPPRRRGQPKGCKTRPRVAYIIDTLPEIMALACVIADCLFQAPVDAAPAAAMQAIIDHVALTHPDQIPRGRDQRIRPPPLVRPTIDIGCSPAQWADFQTRWTRFRSG